MFIKRTGTQSDQVATSYKGMYSNPIGRNLTRYIHILVNFLNKHLMVYRSPSLIFNMAYAK